MALVVYAADVTKIAIGSCYGQFYLANPQILTSISEYHPDLFLWLGDVIYSDVLSLPNLLEMSYFKVWRQLYADFKSTAEYSALLNTTKISGIWDDHDYGINDGDSSFFLKLPSQELFMDFIGDTVDHEGIYRTVEIDSRVKIILLDVRYFRTPEDLLGEVQWKWLEEMLEDRRDITFIASGLQVNVEDRYSLTEQWDNPSRLRLLELIRDKSGIVLLTGDIHFGEILENNCLDYPITEITASGMTHTEYTLYGPLAYWYLFMCNAFSYHQHPRILQKHFGTIEIDWDKESLAFELKATNGKVLIHHSTSFTTLSTKSLNPYICMQSPLKRHITHIASCILIFHLPLILFLSTLTIALRKSTHMH